MTQERVHAAKNGFMMLGINILVFLAVPFLFIAGEAGGALFIVLGFIAILTGAFIAPGYFIIQPNEAAALVLFGKYAATVKTDGFHWAMPFYKKESVSLRAHNFDTEKIKVNDKHGNPIIISAVIVWKVKDTAKALYAVDNYSSFVHTQSESALRAMAGKYSYDNFSDGEDGTEAEVTLREEAEVVNEELERELSERLAEAGVEVLEARINHLAYAEEIASAMLQRQQATAIVAARREIVEGAVGMVEMALEKLNEKQLVELDNDKKAAMVSNLMVVLVGDQQASPVVNTGTLHN